MEKRITKAEQRRKKQQKEFAAEAERLKKQREELNSRPVSQGRGKIRSFGQSSIDPFDKKGWKRFHCVKCDKEKQCPILIRDYPKYKVLCPTCKHVIGKVDFKEALKIHDQNMRYQENMENKNFRKGGDSSQ